MLAGADISLYIMQARDGWILSYFFLLMTCLLDSSLIHEIIVVKLTENFELNGLGEPDLYIRI